MANGRGEIQVLPPINPNRFAGVAGFAQNFLGGINQQFQQKQQAEQLAALGQQIQGGGQINPALFSNPQVAALALQAIQQQQAPRPGFTLGPGQERFTAAGQPIAAGGPVAVSPSQQIAQLKLDTANRISAIPEEERTAGQKETLKRIIEGQAAVQINFPKPASASERTAIADTNASLDALSRLETLFNKSTTVTGPIAGRFETAKGFFGLSSEDQENLLAATAAFKNKVIKDITGAQMSEQEANRIMKQIPLETDPPARWRAKKKQTMINLRTIQKRRIQVLQQSGIRAPGGDVPAIEPQTNTPQSVDDELRALDEQIKALESQQPQQQFQSNPRTGIQPLRF